MWAGVASQKEFEKALSAPDLPKRLRAEVFYKLGMVSAVLQKKPAVAREYWERAVAADPGSRYGSLAEGKLKTASK